MLTIAAKTEQWLIPEKWVIGYDGDPNTAIEVDDSLTQRLEEMNIANLQGKICVYQRSSACTSSFSPPINKPLGEIIVAIGNRFTALEDAKFIPTESGYNLDQIASVILVHELTHYEQFARLGRFDYVALKIADREAEAIRAEDAHLELLIQGKCFPYIRFLP